METRHLHNSEGKKTGESQVENSYIESSGPSSVVGTTTSPGNPSKSITMADVNTLLQEDPVQEPSLKRQKLMEPNPSCSPQRSLPDDSDETNMSTDMAKLLEIKARLKEKEEILHKLKKVELYKTKWSIEELKNQTSQWKEIAITSFEDLFQKSVEEKESLTKGELLGHLGVDPDVLGMDLSQED